MATTTKLEDGWYVVFGESGYVAYRIEDGHLRDSITDAQEGSHRAGGAYVDVHDAILRCDATECMDGEQLVAFCRVADITDDPDPQVGVVKLSLDPPNAPDGWFVLWPECDDYYEIVRIRDREIVAQDNSHSKKRWPKLHKQVKELMGLEDFDPSNCNVGYSDHEAIVKLWSPGADPQVVGVDQLDSSGG